MPRLSRTDAARVRDIREELGSVRLDEPSAALTVMPHVREMLRAVGSGIYRPSESDTGQALDFCRFDQEHPATDPSQRFAVYMAGPMRDNAASDPKPTSDAQRERVFLRSDGAPVFSARVPPPIAQRNRVLLPIDLLTRELWKQHGLYLHVLHPCGLGDAEQLRVLVCEGSSLLAWFGVFTEKVVPRDHRVLAALIPAMRRRLSFDRRIEDAPRKSRALAAALELLAVPAFVVSTKGVVREANVAGRALFDSSREVGRSLRDVALQRPSALDVVLTPFRGDGEGGGFIAMVRTTPDDATARCARAAIRWSLTARQTEVLVCVAGGLANAAIAATLEIALRTVEFHVTALFDRAGVETRSALVASVLAMG